MSVRQHVKKIYNVQDDFGRLGVVSREDFDSWDDQDEQDKQVNVTWENGVSEQQFKYLLFQIHGLSIGLLCNGSDWSKCIKSSMRLTRTVCRVKKCAQTFYTRPSNSTRRPSISRAQDIAETWWAVYVKKKEHQMVIQNYVTLNEPPASVHKNDDSGYFRIWWAYFHPEWKRWLLKRPVCWKNVVDAWETRILTLSYGQGDPQHMQAVENYTIGELDTGNPNGGYIDELECPFQRGIAEPKCAAKDKNLNKILEILQKMTAHKSELSDEDGNPKYGKLPTKIKLNF